MCKHYLDLMEKTLSAYSDEHIHHYFNNVQQYGLTEHGFPRLTSNIGILIANGRRGDLLPTFLEMMEFCCKNIPLVQAANDFSVREIVCCIRRGVPRNYCREAFVGGILLWLDMQIYYERCDFRFEPNRHQPKRTLPSVYRNLTKYS